MTAPTYLHVDTYLLSRLWRRSLIDPDTSCWLWQGARTGPYGLIRAQDGRHISVHIAAWRILVGDIPAGYHLHHRCENKTCWNPAHLEPLTAVEHRRRHGEVLTHCPQGHEYTPENTLIYNGARACRECARARARERNHARAGNCVDCGAALGSPTAKRCRDCHTAYMRSFSHRAGQE